MNHAQCELPVDSLPLHPSPYPPIEDYALLSDCQSNALVSRSGAIDWCCMPTLDADACFGRLLDWAQGGHCSIAPTDVQGVTAHHDYEDDSLIVCTRMQAAQGTLVLRDFFCMDDAEGLSPPPSRLVRLAQCEQGAIDLDVAIVPRFDFGETVPALREHGAGVHTAFGSNGGLLILSSRPLEVVPHEAGLRGRCPLKAGEWLAIQIQFVPPEHLEDIAGQKTSSRSLRPLEDLERTRVWWRQWASQFGHTAAQDRQTRRSALILKGLCFQRTGAIAAASTTSLPETPQGERNWDYRYSWIRDSVFTVKALHILGFQHEARRFSEFIERAAAGSANELQLMYGLDGKRRMPEVIIECLEGYCGARPVRLGNRAAHQTQLDVYGWLLHLAWTWHDKAHPVDQAYWDLLVSVVDRACERWQEPDHGIWEVRRGRRHFVHSKVMCWVAVDRAIRLATQEGLQAPLEKWQATRDAMREAIETRGHDWRMGAYVQAFDGAHLDAASLLLPHFDYVDYRDPRMMTTVQAICRPVGQGGLMRDDGLLMRYDSPDGLHGKEGAFLPCTFWLAECLACQGDHAQAKAVYERAVACANGPGLFSEEMDSHGAMAGNVPQALTHVSQIMAWLALQGKLGMPPLEPGS